MDYTNEEQLKLWKELDGGPSLLQVAVEVQAIGFYRPSLVEVMNDNSYTEEEKKGYLKLGFSMITKEESVRISAPSLAYLRNLFV